MKKEKSVKLDVTAKALSRTHEITKHETVDLVSQGEKLTVEFREWSPKKASEKGIQ